MLSALTTSFRALALHIRIAIGMHDYPPPSANALTDFPPTDGTTISVSFWCQLLTEHCLVEPNSRKYEVVEVKRCKRISGTQHEYLLATIQHPNHNTPRRLRIERFRESVDDAGIPVLLESQRSALAAIPEDTAPGLWSALSRERNDPQSPSAPRKANTGVSQSSAKISKIAEAHDTVRFWELHQHPLEPVTTERILETLDLSRNPLPMYQLAILANAVHDQQSLYNLFKSQCYWYTNMIARVIARRSSINSDQESGNPATDTDHCFDPRDGKFWRIPVHTVRPKIVDAIEKEFNARCAAFDQKCQVRHFIVSPTSKR
ncbi:hypothetical protein NLJ89_g292 [Agrocybe chaxingu]|uniref:Uncharacterized protein n=1 Tax=Agrocybe chaxingu TaxID=84603 RepID=A0A9W8N237_9AGAR|nr:hypothetical protein NLJ89_g292 [Agrocybe chaxingu]